MIPRSSFTGAQHQLQASKAEDYLPLSMARDPWNKSIYLSIAQRCSNPCKIPTLHSIHFNRKQMSRLPHRTLLPLGPKKQITGKHIFITREDRKKTPKTTKQNIKIDGIDKKKLIPLRYRQEKQRTSITNILTRVKAKRSAD